jgi:hypothetical protein
LIRAWQDEVPPAREAQPNSRVATPAAEPMAAQAAASLIEAPAVSETRAAAPVAEPPQLAAITAASTASPERRVNSVFSLEETYGRNWPYKLGITLLAIGIVNFWIYELGHAAPVRIVLISYVVATVLLAGGIFLERRERQRIPGHTLIGGGWALLFFTTYALGHVDAMRVMKWETADLVLMLAVASGMVVHTLRYRSQLVTALCFLLGYSTVALSHDTVYSLAAGVVLAIGLVSIVLRMRWFDLELFGILSSYLTLSYSLQGIFRPVGAQGHSFRDYLASTSVLFSYWTTFRVSYIVRRIQSSAEETISTIAALLNTFLLLGAMKFQSVHPELAFDVLLAIGAAELTIAQLPVTKHRRRAFVLLTALGTALMAAAVPLRYSANDVAILWLVGALVLLLAGTIFDEIVFRRLGQFAGLLVALQLAANGLRQVMAPR